MNEGPGVRKSSPPASRVNSRSGARLYGAPPSYVTSRYAGPSVYRAGSSCGDPGSAVASERKFARRLRTWTVEPSIETHCSIVHSHGGVAGHVDCGTTLV